jgi:DNA-binding transcriptional MocR family regulator
MSYKIDLSDVDRGGEVSITQQLVDRFAEAIDGGELEPGEKLPTTRALATEAGVNHLTAARVYRRLAETGYVTASVGRGTFVRTLAPAPASEERGDDWQVYVLPDRPFSQADQVLDDAFRLPGEPGMISLSTGFPSPQTYPVKELSKIAATVFERRGGEALDYLTAEGLPELREQLALRGRKIGWATDADEIIVTSGARQATELVARALLDAGDVAVIESPTFVGSLSSLRNTGARVIGVPYDSDGLDLDALEQVLARHEVKVVALQTASQNPTGNDMSQERRERLARLAMERNFFIVEDGVYADLRYDGPQGRPLRELAPGHVIYLSSLSKTVGGGLRIGWVAARGPVLERIAYLKLETDFFTSAVTQHIAAEFLENGDYDGLLARSIEFYRERRDSLMESLERHLPGEYRAATPRGGHHVWVTLNRAVDERTFYAEAVRHGVTYVPGATVVTDRPAETSLRLSFSMVDPGELDEGVRRIARALREMRRRDRRAATVPLS